MKKNVLDDIEQLKEERKISKEEQNKILRKAISNAAMGIAMIIILMLFVIIANWLTKTVATKLYNIYSIAFLIFAVAIIEIAYKKDNGEWALTGIETLALSIFTLFAPYIFILGRYKFIYGFIVLITIYYSSQIIRVYISGKKEYLKKLSDINNIIKKESKDDLAKLEFVKREEERKEILAQEQKSKSKKKTTKTTKSKSETKSKTTSKKQGTKTTAKKQDTKTAPKKTTSKKQTGATTKGTTTRKVSGETTKKATTKKSIEGTQKKTTTAKKTTASKKTTTSNKTTKPTEKKVAKKVATTANKTVNEENK